MNEKCLIKKQLIEECKKILEREIVETKKAMDDAQEEANFHKGAMESRYDTFKEEAQYKAGAYAKKLVQLGEQLANINMFKIELHDSIKVGSIVFTSDKNYFLIGFFTSEPIQLNGKSFNLISPNSPFGQKLLNRKKGICSSSTTGRSKLRTYFNPVKKFIVAFEGADGVGKTTIARSLSVRYNYSYLKTPSTDLNFIKKNLYECFKIHPLIRFYFYLSTLWETYYDILNNHTNKIFLITRYFLSTYIYHKILFQQLNLERFISNISDFKIYPPLPDLIIVLVTTTQIRFDRIIKRKIFFPSAESLFEENLEFQDRVQKEIATFPGVNVIDVSNLKVDEVVEKCNKLIQFNYAKKINKLSV